MFMLQKAKAHLCVLRQSTTLDNEAKQRIEPVPKASFMSSDESMVEDSDNSNSGSNSEEDEDKSSTAKTLIRHKLPW